MKFGWVGEQTYLPGIEELRCAESSSEGSEALYQYFFPGYVEQRYEIWTKEFIAGLAEHILPTISDPEVENPTILEVGAGDGRLSGFLRQAVELEKVDVQVVATDFDPPFSSEFPIDPADAKEALRKHNPTVVLSSWMPLGDEWTWDMRATESVQEYILMGVPCMTGSFSTWQNYSSPELGTFTPTDLTSLNEQKSGQFSRGGIPGYETITRSFKRQPAAV